MFLDRRDVRSSSKKNFLNLVITGQPLLGDPKVKNCREGESVFLPSKPISDICQVSLFSILRFLSFLAALESQAQKPVHRP